MSSILAVRGTLFIDIDGTIVDNSTEEALPGAVKKINKAHDDGYTVILTTMRGEGYGQGSKFACASTLRLLKSIGLKYSEIIWNCQSPRTVINDEGCNAIQHKTNGS